MIQFPPFRIYSAYGFLIDKLIYSAYGFLIDKLIYLMLV